MRQWTTAQAFGPAVSHYPTPARERFPSGSSFVEPNILGGLSRRASVSSGRRRRRPRKPTFRSKGSSLVDPASSHMLVSKLKPCKSQYRLY